VNAGLIILLSAAIIIYFGFAHRVLDRLRLNDRAALGFLVAMIVGGFLPDLPLGANVSVNIGGGIIPVVLVVYLWSKVERAEINRNGIAVLITAAAVFAAMKIIPLEPTYNFFLDPLYITALIAGLVGYLSGRSRRGAFTSGTMAVVLNDLASGVENIFAGVRSNIVIGGAGIFDAVVIAGFLALGLAEIVGETAERITLETSGREEENPDEEQ